MFFKAQLKFVSSIIPTYIQNPERVKTGIKVNLIFNKNLIQILINLIDYFDCIDWLIILLLDRKNGELYLDEFVNVKKQHDLYCNKMNKRFF